MILDPEACKILSGKRIAPDGFYLVGGSLLFVCNGHAKTVDYGTGFGGKKSVNFYDTIDFGNGFKRRHRAIGRDMVPINKSFVEKEHAVTDVMINHVDHAMADIIELKMYQTAIAKVLGHY